MKQGSLSLTDAAPSVSPVDYIVLPRDRLLVLISVQTEVDHSRLYT